MNPVELESLSVPPLVQNGTVPHVILDCPFSLSKVSALYRKSILCIPWNKRPRHRSISTFMYLWAIYIFPGSAWVFGCKIGRLILGICKSLRRSQLHKCGNWETEHYNSVLEIMRPHSFFSGNTLIGARHLYWILTDPTFAVCTAFAGCYCTWYCTGLARTIRFSVDILKFCARISKKTCTFYLRKILLWPWNIFRDS